MTVVGCCLSILVQIVVQLREPQMNAALAGIGTDERTLQALDRFPRAVSGRGEMPEASVRI